MPPPYITLNRDTIKRFEKVGEELGIKVVRVLRLGLLRLVPCVGRPTRIGALSVACLSAPHGEDHKC